MPFFHYNQNNSGGDFEFDKENGISCHVIIEADNPEEADSILITKGGYFYGVEDGQDCGCCGDRWDRAYGNGDTVPSIFGQPIVNNQYRAKLPIKWAPEGTADAYIHYKGERGIVPVLLVVGSNADA